MLRPCCARRPENQALQQGGCAPKLTFGMGRGLSRVDDGMNSIPEPAIDDGLVLALMSCALVDSFAEINPVVRAVHVALVYRLALLVQRAFLRQGLDQLAAAWDV